MVNDVDFLLDESFDLEEALKGPEKEKTLRALADLLASELYKIKSVLNVGVDPAQFEKIKKTAAGLAAASEIVRKMHFSQL